MPPQVNRLLARIHRTLSGSGSSADTLGSLRSMSANRLTAAVCILAYFALSGMTGEVSVAEYATSVLYLSIAAFIFLNLYGWPRRRFIGRYSAMVLDVGTLSIANVAFGASVALLYPFYLWIIVGNAFRFGIPCLAAATLMSSIGFGTAVVVSPFWSTIPVLASGLLSGLVVVPLYFGFLLLRERAKNEQLDAANKSKAFILSTIGHELRAPLAVVVALHDVLRDTSLSRKQQAMVKAAGMAAKTTMAELDDLLDVARIGAGRMRVTPVNFQLLDLITELIELARIVATTSSVQIAFHVAADVPLVVTVDRRHLRKILLALLYNAVGFTAVGIIVLTVSRKDPSQSPAYLIFEVTDTGIGVPVDMQARIFEAYVQADTETLAGHHGSGLGLAVAHHLVDLLGGTVAVRSRTGEGSTFEVELPVGVPPVPAPGDSDLTGYAVVIVSGDWKQAEDFAFRLRKLRATSLVLDQVGRLDVTLEKAAAGADRIMLLIDGRGADALSLVQALQQDPVIRGVPLVLLRQAAAWLPLAMRQAFVSAVAADSTDVETVAAFQIAARAATGMMGTGHDTNADEEGEPGEFPVGNTMSQSSRRLYVLVADGHRTTQILVSRMLEAEGHIVTVVGDGDQVLSAIAVQEFDAVLVDLDLPEINGFDIAKMIRMTGHYALPVIGLTSNAGAHAQRCASATIESYLVKPINKAQLQEILHQVANPPATSSEAAAPARLAEHGPGITSIASHPHFRVGSGAPLEEDALQEVAVWGDRAFVETFIQAFSADTAAIFHFLDAAARRGDEILWQSQIRALRTQAQTIGARRLETLCEAGAKVDAGRLASDGKALADRLSFEVVRVREALERMS